jgi:hypothetical protein
VSVTTDSLQFEKHNKKRNPVMVDGNPFSAVASGLTSGLTLVIRICEFTYALQAVSEQTFAYLQTTEHVSENIKTARRLRRQSSNLLPADEKKDMDRVIRETETAVRSVAVLLEPARVDREADQKIRLTTRGLWVLRDNPNIAAALNRLQIAHHALNQVIGSLRTPRSADGLVLTESNSSKSPPPAYEASQLLHWRMQSRLDLHRDAVLDAARGDGLGIQNMGSCSGGGGVAVHEAPPTTAPSSSPPQRAVANRNYAELATPSQHHQHHHHTSNTSQSAPQVQVPFTETFFSAAQPWHHPPESFFSAPTSQSAVVPDLSHSAPEAASPSQTYTDIFPGLEVVDSDGLAPLTQATSHKTWLSYQASRSVRRRRPDRYSLP